jgi:hypothetical protein
MSENTNPAPGLQQIDDVIEMIKANREKIGGLIVSVAAIPGVELSGRPGTEERTKAGWTVAIDVGVAKDDNDVRVGVSITTLTKGLREDINDMVRISPFG